MKKFVVSIAFSCLLLGGMGQAFAAEETYESAIEVEAAEDVIYEDSLSVEQAKEVNKKGEKRFELLKEFRDEIHQLNQLKMERLTLRIQVIEKHDTILDLYIDARENNDTEALKAAQELKKNLDAINQEIKSRTEYIQIEKKAFKEQIKAGHKEVAERHLQNIITIKSSINQLVEKKLDVLDQVIEVLQ